MGFAAPGGLSADKPPFSAGAHSGGHPQLWHGGTLLLAALGGTGLAAAATTCLHLPADYSEEVKTDAGYLGSVSSDSIHMVRGPGPYVVP